jgi:hypothetical protein
MDRSYYVDLPPRVASERWRDFQHELNFPGEQLQVRFEPLPEEPARTRVCVAGELERADYAIGRFRLFLESRGLIELTPPGNSRQGS